MIRFDEGPHQYHILIGDEYVTKGVVSCTGFIHKYFSHFDPKAESLKMHAKLLSGRGTPEQRLLAGLTADEIAAHWTAKGADASGLGSAMHNAIEAYYNEEYSSVAEMPHTREFANFVLFHRTEVLPRGLKPFRTELMVWSAPLLFCGSIDMIFVRGWITAPDGRRGLSLIVADWKRSKSIRRYGFGGAKGTGPCSRLQDCNYSHYSLQLNIYKWFLETEYQTGWVYEGTPADFIQVDELFLVVCHPDNDSYIKIDVGDLSDVVGEMIQERRDFIERKEHEPPSAADVKVPGPSAGDC